MALHRPECEHDSTEDYQPYWNHEHRCVVFPTEEEAEYPWGLCEAYGRAARSVLTLDEHIAQILKGVRLEAIEEELKKYHRTADAELRAILAEKIYEWEIEMHGGEEKSQLNKLLRFGHYRGTDIRLAVEVAGARQMFPYPAYRWLWKDFLAFRWKVDGHINVLEGQALLAHIRRLMREERFHGRRLMVVLDSQVIFYALGKGRSPASRLNRLLRRIGAMVLFGDVYLFPIWTLSAWNFADRPSRR